MVFNLPNLYAARNKYGYTDIFLYTTIWNISIYTIITFSLWLIFGIIKRWKVPQEKIQQEQEKLLFVDTQKKQSMFSSNTSRVSINRQEENNKAVLIERQKSQLKKWHKAIIYTTSFFFYITLLLFSAMFLAAFMFGKIGIGTGKDVLAVFILSMMMILPTFLWKFITRRKPYKLLKKQAIITIILLLIWIITCILAVLATRRGCSCAYNDHYGYKINTDFMISTQYTRSKTFKQVCPSDTVCNVYATLPQDTSTAFFLNIHTGTDIDSVQMAVKSQEQYKLNPFFQYIQSADKFNIGHQTVQQHGRRNVFSALFTELEPGTIYIVRIQAGSNNIFTKYKTLPDYHSPNSLKIAFGGDVGMTTQGQKLTLLLNDFNPDVIIIGGDIAYDDAMPSCYYSWDTFYNIFNALNNKIGRLVPLILTVGNHDVGFDALSGIKITINEEGPFYFGYHPQHYADPITRTGIPSIKDRKTFHYHLIGKTVHIILDSGYIHKYQDQVAFITQVSEKYQQYQKFSNYHNPIYPSCTDKSFIVDINNIASAKKHWVPIFEKYNFTASMQHHTHQMKLTKQLFNDKEDNVNGIYYLGDGSWGVYNHPCPQKNRVKDDIFLHTDNDNTNHVWQMTVTDDQISYIARNVIGDIMASQIQSFKTYPTA